MIPLAVSTGDAVYLAACAAVVCIVFALEPLWNVLWRHLHRGDRIDHPLGKTRLGK